jgi:uncharacterized ferredoxin-like protein
MSQYLDLGIAVGSVAAQAKTPSLSATVSFFLWGCSLLLQKIEADIAMGLPLSVKGKNIFFDRESTRKVKEYNYFFYILYKFSIKINSV